MASKAQVVAARLVTTEVAPPQVLSVMRLRRVPSLDTIAEEEREQPTKGPAPHRQQTAAPPPQPRTQPQKQQQERERAGTIVRELSKYFSDGHHGAGGGSWETAPHGYWRAGYSHKMRNRSGPYMASYILGY